MQRLANIKLIDRSVLIRITLHPAWLYIKRGSRAARAETERLCDRRLHAENDPSNRPNVSQLLLQPFVNYNMTEGWYLVSSPIITANWEASSDNKWAFPLGAGIGKIFRIGEQPMNASLQSFDYLQSPTGGPRWAVRAQLQFLFPR
ncbi:MAG: hypothetical protein WA869_24440 [Alloacidobacterium sp.]